MRIPRPSRSRARLRGPLAGALVLALAACGAEAPQEEAAPAEDAAPVAEAPGPVTPEAADTAVASDALVNPNDASAEAIAAIPGMTPEAAEVLVAGRPYQDMLEVDAVLADHLDESGRETAYRSLWLPLDLNGASAEEILLIPGVGERMQHEFEEYRPYRAMAEFRREIGKYVDEEEVARLERYVELR